MSKIIKIRRRKEDMKKGADTLSFCGVIRLPEDALLIQNKLREEWKNKELSKIQNSNDNG